MPGLGDLDVNAAAQNLAAVGQPAPMMGPPVSLMTPPVAPALPPLQEPPVPVQDPTVALPPNGAPVAPQAPPVAPGGLPPPIVPTGDIPGIQAASVAEQKAAGDIDKATGEAAAAKSAEELAAAKIHDQEAEELRQTNERQQRAQDEAHRQTEEALNQARSTTIPAFFGSNEGKRAETAMWVGLGGIAQGLLGSGTNGAADIVSKNVDAYYRREKEKIDNLYAFAAKKGESESSLRLQHTQELAGIQAQYGATKLAIAQRIDAMATAGQGRIDQAKAKELAAKYAMEGQKDIEDAQLKLAQIAHLNAQAARERAKAAGSGGGAGRGDAYDKFRAAILAGDPNIGKLAAAAGIKPKEIEAQRTAIAEEEDKRKKLAGEANKAGAAGAAKENLPVRDVGGNVVGYFPGGRGIGAWKTTQDELRKLDTAIGQIERFKATGKWFPRGAAWDAAVLAIAATSNAGTSIPALEHEAGTLRSTPLTVDKQAVETKLEELKSRKQKTINQLLPSATGTGGPSGGGAIPPGGQAATKKSTGQKGYVLNGEFHAF